MGYCCLLLLEIAASRHLLVPPDGLVKLADYDHLNDVDNQHGYADSCQGCGPRLQPPSKLLCATITVLIAPNAVATLPWNRLASIGVVLRADSPTAAHLAKGR